MEHAQHVAMVRGLITAVATAGVSFFGTWLTALQATDVSDEGALTVAAVNAGLGFFTVMLARFGAEGTIDAARDARDGRTQ